MGPIIVFVVLFIIAVALIVSNIRIVPQAHSYVIERLGSFKVAWDTGLHVKVPFIERIVTKVSLKERVVDFAPQPVITKDNVTMMIDTVVYFQITDPKLFTYGVDNPLSAIENLTATTLRNIIGDLELDESLTSRDIINTKMRAILDEATDPWGIKVNRVELKNILPPKDIQEAMEKQMRAERERRESILRAEGKKRSAILIAEGDKESKILQAEAYRDAVIKRAEGDAKQIMLTQEATANGLKFLLSAASEDTIVKLKGLDALKEISDTPSTKLIIPSDLQGLAALASSAKEIVSNDPIKKVENE